MSLGLSDHNGCFTAGFLIHDLLHIWFYLLMVPLRGYFLSVAVLAQSRRAFVSWQMTELHFPQAALRRAMKVNKKVARVFGKKWVRLRENDGVREQEPNGMKDCSLGERAERLGHSSGIAALRYPRFLLARYYGLADVQLLINTPANESRAI